MFSNQQDLKNCSVQCEPKTVTPFCYLSFVSC